MISVPSVKPFAVRSPMAEYVQFTTTRSTGTWGGLNTAYVGWKGSANLTVEWSGTGWSGGNATQVYSGLGSVTENYAYISRAASGAGSKTIRCYPTDTSGTRIGSVTQIAFTFSSPTQTTTPLTSVDLKNARELQILSIDGRGTGLTSVDVSDMKKLASFTIMNGAGLTSDVNVTNCTSLSNLYLSNLSNITSVTGLSSLKNNLQSLSLDNCSSITSLDVSDFGYLYNLSLLGCLGLTTLRAQNVMLYSVSYGTGGGYAYSLNGGANLQYTGLTGGGLNQFFTDLATETTPNPAIIAVFGAPGAGNNDPSIATAKNYTVIGNLPP